MRNLYYKLYTGNSFKEAVKTLKEANAAKAAGLRVKVAVKDAPRPLPKMSEKRKAARVRATKPNA